MIEARFAPKRKNAPRSSDLGASYSALSLGLPQERVRKPTVHVDHLARGAGQAIGHQQEHSFRLIFRCDGLLEQRAIGVELRQAVAKRLGESPSLKGMLYLVSDEITRSRGNIVLPFTTVAGATAFTRTSGANSTASSRMRWLAAAFDVS